MDDRRLYETILGLEEPWQVAEVEVEPEAEEIRVRLEMSEGAPLVCPECGRAGPGYDRAEERRWRHLDTCQYRTVLIARIPRLECVEHGVRQIRVPWAEDRSPLHAAVRGTGDPHPQRDHGLRAGRRHAAHVG